MLLVVGCIGCELSFSLCSAFSERESNPFLLLHSFIKEKVLKHHKHTSRTIRLGWNRNKHMSSLIHPQILFPDNIIHAKIHFIVYQALLNSSLIDQSLLILNFPIINFQSNKNGVLIADIQCT